MAQAENPVAIGLMLCDQVIVDKDTNKVSPIGIFTGLAVDDFSEPRRFSAFAALTNGRGQTAVELNVFQLANGDQIHTSAYQLSFPDPLVVVNLNLRLKRIRFPAPGWYDFVLRANGEHIAQRRIRVYQVPPEKPS
jgi:hypothetical protein